MKKQLFRNLICSVMIAIIGLPIYTSIEDNPTIISGYATEDTEES